jgi:Ca2+-binding RTX toxin-like protein
VETIIGSSLLGDTIDLSGASVAPATGTVANLTSGVVTVNGTAPLPLSFTVSQFENVIGSGFADTITGNTANNSLSGGGGNDTFFGSAGNDTLNGGLGNDIANYNALTNVVTLSAFGVLNKGALGTDTLIGVETIIGSSLLGDTVDLSGASVAPATGTVANLTSGVVTVNGTAPLPLSFTVSQFENVIGSGFADTITGDTANNSLSGGGGNDTFFSSAGNDTLNGGAGLDTANYSALANTVSLGAFGVLNKGALGIDNLIGVETIVGSSLLGDTVNHSGAVSIGGVSVTGTTTNLSTGVVTVNGSGAPLPLTFNVQQFENVIGSNFNDSITGNAAANSLDGGLGNDTLFGSAGNDTLNGGAGTDDATDYTSIGATVTLSAQGVLNKGPLLGIDTLIGIERIVGSSLLGDTVDLSGAIAPAISTTTNLATGLVTINGPTGVLLVNGTPLSFTVSQFENVTGSSLADTITGNSSDNILLGGNGNDILNGGAGNDTLNGGADIDTASYLDTIAAVTVSLNSGNNGTASGGAGNDTLISIENIIGSSFADTITGSSAANILNGGAGNDSIFGGLGNDLIIGGAGKDTLLGEADADTFSFASFADSLLANYDVIGDFTNVDVIDGPGLITASINTSNGIASGLSAAQVSVILNNFSFTANSTKAFTAIGFSGTFVAFNDGVAGFNEFTDSIVQLASFNLGGTNSISIV